MKRASSNAPAGLNVKKITAYLKGQAKSRNAVRITCQGGSVYIITGYAAFKLPAVLYPECDPARDHAGRPPPMA